MRLGRVGVALIAAAAAATMAVPAGAVPVVGQLARAVREGTATARFGERNPCAATVSGRLLNLGCLLRVVTTAPGSAAEAVTTRPAGYGADDLAAAYRMPAPATGPDNRVSIIAVGAYPTAESDLAHYRSTYGLPPCTTANGCLTIGDFHGGPALPPSGGPLLGEVEEAYATETALDLQMASAGCPTCRINLVQIPLQYAKLVAASALRLPGALARDFGTAVNRAAAMGSAAVSMSYGLPPGLQAGLLGTGAPAKDLDHPGMAIFAASGDSGFAGNTQIWPQQLPTVTSVGGTTVRRSGRGYGHTAWGGEFTPSGGGPAQFAGAGSGCAPNLPPAVGQPASVSAVCGGHRATSDVSAVADPNTGVAVYDTYTPSSGTGGGWLVVGGTSAASPLVAGFAARGGHVAGVHGPNTMYAAPPGALLDVTAGSNAADGSCNPAVECAAGPGWDGPTGMGTPQGLAAF